MIIKCCFIFFTGQLVKYIFLIISAGGVARFSFSFLSLADHMPDEAIFTISNFHDHAHDQVERKYKSFQTSFQRPLALVCQFMMI